MALEGMLHHSFNLNTYSCDNGHDALKVFQDKLRSTCCSQKFELVLTDIQMPEMDGFRLAELIQATERGWYKALNKQSSNGMIKTQTTCRIVAVTAFTSGIEEKAKKAGISLVI